MDYSKIGNHLKLVRERKGLSYDQIFEITRIQPSILKGIEEGRAEVSPVFLKGFIKSYARALGVDSSALFNEGEEGSKNENETKSIDNTQTKKKYKTEKKFSNYGIVSGILFVIFLLLWLPNFYKEEEPVKEEALKEKVEKQAIELKQYPVESLDHKNNLEKQIIENSDQNLKPHTLFDQIKNSVYEEDLLIQSSESFKIYFKVDGQSTVTKTLQAQSWFRIKAKHSIYLRFDEKRGDVRLFYNGKEFDFGDKDFFEKTFSQN